MYFYIQLRHVRYDQNNILRQVAVPYIDQDPNRDTYNELLR